MKYADPLEDILAHLLRFEYSCHSQVHACQNGQYWRKLSIFTFGSKFYFYYWNNFSLWPLRQQWTKQWIEWKIRCWQVFTSKGILPKKVILWNCKNASIADILLDDLNTLFFGIFFYNKKWWRSTNNFDILVWRIEEPVTVYIRDNFEPPRWNII